MATAMLAMVAAGLGVSFAGPTGLTDVSVTAASNNFVYPVGADKSGPTGLGALSGGNYTTALKYTDTNGFNPSGSFASTNVVTPSWAPVAGAAGSVTTAGDLAVIDARSATLGVNFSNLRVTVFITNLDKLQPNYSSFAFPLNVYQCTGPCSAKSHWTPTTLSGLTAPYYITNTDGFVSFTLAKATDRWYDIAIDTGGSFYTIGTTDDATRDLAPQFYFTAQAI